MDQGIHRGSSDAVDLGLLVVNSEVSHSGGALAGTDEHARPLHIALLLFGVIGILLDIAACFTPRAMPWGGPIGIVASLFATVAPPPPSLEFGE